MSRWASILYFCVGTLLTVAQKENFKIIEQPYATYHTQTVTNTTVTNGYVQIYPHYDLGKDTIITPEPVGQVNVDLWDYSGGGLNVKLNGKVQTKTFDAAYARPQDIRIKVTGLKPNTKYLLLKYALKNHQTNSVAILSLDIFLFFSKISCACSFV